VAEVTELRDVLAAQQVEYRVVKNTLMRLAGDQTGASVLEPYLKGTCAVAIALTTPPFRRDCSRDSSRTTPS